MNETFDDNFNYTTTNADTGLRRCHLLSNMSLSVNFTLNDTTTTTTTPATTATTTTTSKYCVHLTITPDTHYEDATWTITSDSNFTTNESLNMCVEIVDECFDFTINDVFGDGLSYGEGDWD